MHSEGADHHVCATCGASASERCSRCKIVYYCSREHQISDWRKHRKECASEAAAPTVDSIPISPAPIPASAVTSPVSVSSAPPISDTHTASPVKEETCLTLDEDGVRCPEPATHGHRERRCRIHHAQYRNMTKSYKDASRIVDGIDVSAIPDQSQIGSLTEYELATSKARLIKRYLEAIRVEKKGREIHHKRFFLKIDDAHKMRLKVLAKRMVGAVEVLNALLTRAFEIRMDSDPKKSWVQSFQDTPISGAEKTTTPLSRIQNAGEEDAQAESVMQVLERSDAGASQKKASSQERVEAPSEADDPIEMELRAEKRKYLDELYFIRESCEDRIKRRITNPKHREDPEIIRAERIRYDTQLQYMRRIVMHDPVLGQKALDKVSLNDLLLDPDFSVEDFERIWILLAKRMAIGLLWWKDSTLEALAMWSKGDKSGNVANLGKLEDRYPVIGGWVYNTPHKQNMTNEGWWYLLDATRPEANIENRYMRLCNSFDDMHALFSFGALGMMPSPSFCETFSPTFKHERSLLSLCGVIICDAICSPFPSINGPIPTTKPAVRRGHIKWMELESRAYMFGAIRNEPDPFAEAFVAELRARPDLFIVITRSETDPGRQTEIFGPTEDGRPIAQWRFRTFEAPAATLQNRPRGRGSWTVMRSLTDMLYGSGDSVKVDALGAGLPTLKGYMTELAGPKSAGWLFHFKKFPVKYFVIVDATPNRDGTELGKEVAWAAMRARGFAKGAKTSIKYIRASDNVLKKRSEELLGWLPSGVATWKVQTVESQMREMGAGGLVDMMAALNV
ncbi:hypothetical protein BV25DRAFT_1437724 [Artomyces pyxidatus]|uniref:Uncharacterized protein n=1 Tax=Artomyces pyxidatus TaxID=48021 RepID=A0ACB8SNU4_9AGAM|nr:hypothetical protein BV25DRAFT_1437724 [Artomyces pyxidatus]